MEQPNSAIIQGPDNAGENRPERDERGRILPGHTLNPLGKKKGTISIVARIKEKLQELLPGDNIDKKTYLDALVEALLNKAMSGDVKAIITIINYIDGLPKQTYTIEEEEEVENSSTLAEIINRQAPEERKKSMEALTILYDLTKNKEENNQNYNN